MPIYEYRCAACRRALNFLVRSIAGHQPPVCPKCGHAKMERVLSRFAAITGGARADAEPSSINHPPSSMPPPGGAADIPPGMERLLAEAEGMDETDPRAMGRLMRQMAAASGEPMPDELSAVVRRLEAGEDPEKIEEQMGDEAGGGPGAPDGADNTLYEA